MTTAEINELAKTFSPPPANTIDVYVEIEEEDVHFLDAIMKSYDGVANVRREYRMVREQKQFRVLVSRDLLEETKEVLRNLRQYIYIGEIIVEG